ncbi:hypothetical protein QN395_14725 [Undibacterium sp. RTI2.2]|nr:hypothetical protein [Undibacterium sp. RTI2.2]
MFLPAQINIVDRTECGLSALGRYSVQDSLKRELLGHTAYAPADKTYN